MDQEGKTLKSDDWIDEEFDFSDAMNCPSEHQFTMYKETSRTSWEMVRERVARETGQNLDEPMRYHPPEESEQAD